MAIIGKRARLYRLSYKALAWLPQKPLALFLAVWLGLLDAQSLDEITLAGYTGQGEDGFAAQNFNFKGWWPWEHEAVQNNFSGCRRVLVAGAGGGREVIALARMGFEVTAIDFCADLTAACRHHLQQAGLVATVLDAPPGCLPDGLGRWDGILVGRGFYHHIPTRARRISFLRQCRMHLDADAPLLISDFFIRPTPSRGSNRTYAIASRVRRWRGSAEAVELGDFVSESFGHLFVRDEIAGEMQEAGFRIASWKDSPFGEGSHLAHASGKAIP